MRLSPFIIRLLILPLLLAGGASSAKQTICVYDPTGTQGFIYNMMRDYVVAMQRYGADIDIKAYSNEAIAVDDYRAKQCDGFGATAFRTRPFNPTAAAIDSLGVTSILRDGHVDIQSSYEVLRKLVQTYAAKSPRVSKLMTRGDHVVGGIIPIGVAYPMVNDRSIDTVEELAGKRIPAFDYDKAQAIMIRKIGAQPVSADTSNFHIKFNNGLTDMIAAPTILYKALELHKGIGTKGGVARFPIMLLTYQMILDQSKFPEDFGAISRAYWSQQYDRALQLVRQTDRDIPLAAWIDLDPKNAYDYTLMLRDARIDIAKQGIYDKRGLKIIKRIRCKINNTDPECATESEEVWN
jgi:Family of unknown function (DUF6091)